jgi:hypothetical protein
MDFACHRGLKNVNRLPFTNGLSVGGYSSGDQFDCIVFDCKQDTFFTGGEEAFVGTKS